MAGRYFATLTLLCILQAPALAQGPDWKQLSAQQRTALAPLSKDWDGLPDGRKQKWLGIARRYGSLNPVAQARLQDRMREWVALSPEQRALARDQYKKLRTASQEQKRELGLKWQEYEALPSSEKERLQAAASAPRARPPIVAGTSLPSAPYATALPKTLLQAPPSSKHRPLASASSITQVPAP